MKRHPATPATAKSIMQMSELDNTLREFADRPTSFNLHTHDASADCKMVVESAELHDDMEYHSFILKNEYYQPFQKYCTAKKVFFFKKRLDGEMKITLKNPNQDARDVRQIVELILGLTNHKVELWKPGTLVQAKDKSFTRSYYEVIADNGNAVILLFRFLASSSYIQCPEFSYAFCVRRRELFTPAIDMELPASDLTVQLPENWVRDYKKIKVRHNKSSEELQMECYVCLEV